MELTTHQEESTVCSDVLTHGLPDKGHKLRGCRRSLTVLHHDGEEAHYDFGAGPDEDLPLAAFLRIVDAFQRVGEDVHAHHDACKTHPRIERSKTQVGTRFPSRPVCSEHPLHEVHGLHNGVPIILESAVSEERPPEQLYIV